MSLEIESARPECAQASKATACVEIFKQIHQVGSIPDYETVMQSRLTYETAIRRTKGSDINDKNEHIILDKGIVRKLGRMARDRRDLDESRTEAHPKQHHRHQYNNR